MSAVALAMCAGGIWSALLIVAYQLMRIADALERRDKESRS